MFQKVHFVVVSILTFREIAGDISLVAALGDFVAAGTGALSNDITGSDIDYRGVSFLGGISSFLAKNHRKSNNLMTFLGGDGNWREILTLPNILEVFNPALKGAAKGEHKL